MEPAIRRLRLRPPLVSDADEFAKAHAELALDGFEFGIGFDPAQSFDSYVAAMRERRCHHDLPDGWVPGTFLVAEVDGTLVGRLSIRHELNEFLRSFGGHIGYGVRPAHRGRGYAGEMLRQGLVIARAVGIDRVLLTCDDDNTPSSRVIEGEGGVLENVVERPDGGRTRRYWID
jgi:predicted acetyltransferase